MQALRNIMQALRNIMQALRNVMQAPRNIMQALRNVMQALRNIMQALEQFGLKTELLPMLEKPAHRNKKESHHVYKYSTSSHGVHCMTKHKELHLNLVQQKHPSPFCGCHVPNFKNSQLKYTW